jgi:membrane-bound lytic murein transglycosylase D
MSANDLSGPRARISRSHSPESVEDWRVETRRRMRLASLLIAALVAVPLVWLRQGSDERAETLDALGVTEPVPPNLPLHVNARVESWLERFRTTRRDEFDKLLRRRGLFEELIRGKLRERGLPEELLYMAMIESGFTPFAVSRVSAVGLWQFMSPTAMQYGLRVDDYVDERRDPVRATDAALEYVEYLYDRFGSWYLAAAAFNAGPGRVERILHRHAEGRIGDEDIYWEVLEHLPRETREYIPKLIAVTVLANDADLVGYTHTPAQPYRYENVFVPASTPLSAIADALDIDGSILRELNPHLIRGVTPPNEGYSVRVPVGESAEVVKRMASTKSMRRADD